MSVHSRASVVEIQMEWKEIQAAKQNPSLFKPLYERYFERIFRYIYRRTNDESLSGDLCSRVFIKALDKLGGYQFRGVPFSSWLFRIAGNEVMQHYRDTSRKRVISLEEHNLNDMADEMTTRYNEQSKQLMLNVLDQLSLEEVTLVEMRFFEQRPFKEIAEILGITENNAKVKTYRILAKMKKRMLQEQPPQ